MSRLVLSIVILLCAAGGFAEERSGQGKSCSGSAKCEAGLTCTKGGDGSSTCQIACKPTTKCPEDQRCIKDNGHMICRPITDVVQPNVQPNF